ncbi:hypothetical protein Tco_0420986 [Tanacetum coccineum]
MDSQNSFGSRGLTVHGLDSCVLGDGTRYFESNRGWGRGVKEKQHGSTNANVVSSSIDEPNTTAPINSGNKNGTEEGNIEGIPSPANDENLNDVGTTVRPTPVGNTPGMSSYANVTGEPSRKALNFRTLFTLRGNRIDVVVLMESIRVIIERSSYAKAMIELQVDVELKDTIVVAMPKLTGEGFYTCTNFVEYEWKPPKCACCKVFGHIQEEFPKNSGLGVAKNLKKPS